MEGGILEDAIAKDQSEQGALAAGHRKRGPEDESVEAARDAKEPRLQEPAVTSGGEVPSSAGQPNASPNAPTTTGTFLTAAYSEDKGCRNTMEDVCVLSLDARLEGQSETCRLAYFGIFDGHGGVSCASFAAQHLHARVMESGLIQKGLPTSSDGKPDAKACKTAIVEGYKKTDEALLKECAAKNWQDGACAVTVWVLQELVLVANVGDAKCVLGRLPDKSTYGASDSKPKAIVLTKEHTALLERQRIEKAGGTVVNGRLAGRIQIARSFGDAAFKKLGCSSMPDVTAFPLTARDAFLLLGCDGFWGVFGAQEAVDTAHSLLAEGLGDKAVTNRLLNVAVREKRCKDNCSVMIVRFGSSQAAAVQPDTR
ncbi:hypothetical protein Vafri_5028 [Volvox africanus]|uniref:protein-serine/threonine phosphatase n=1 Tax=Volvox africanus TaxID=51714 RepID=A0A8J4EUI8_9CHLO|nr:hypothetical protein Vafri_5028 [Volvox africanus]